MKDKIYTRGLCRVGKTNNVTVIGEVVVQSSISARFSFVHFALMKKVKIHLTPAMGEIAGHSRILRWQPL